ncbi:MAG: PASTA domain-containing protein [Clostridia bacterium]|nr:PASTA domain-containing protein [Clostridia bacterium]
MFIKPDKTILKRGMFVLIGAVLLWGVLIFRLFWLQVVKYDYYHKLVIDNITASYEIPAARGIIYDCNMTELAINTTVKRVFIAPNEIKSSEEKELVARYLSEILEVDYDKIIEKANKTWRADETIKNYVSLEIADQITAFLTENKITSVHLQDQTLRYYPFDTLASQVIGFTGSEGSGLYGLELQYNEYLTGVSGKIITSVNARGGSIPTKYESYTESESGYNLVTTIDYKMQSILEEQVMRTYYDNDAQSRTCGIIMDCNTGAIRAMATYPNFDLNNPAILGDWAAAKLAAYVPGSDDYSEAQSALRLQMWNNMPVSTLYEPGSTFKIITASIGLEEGAFTDSTLFTCTDPFYVPLSSTARQKVRCWHYGGHGTVTFRRGLQQSCNPTLMQASWLIGKDTFYKYVQAFGFTAKTGIDLPGEGKGIFFAYSNMNILELSIASFGQTFKTTPLQELTAICTIANGGTLVTPYVVSKMVDDEGNTIRDCTPQPKRTIISEKTANLVTEILTEGVSTDGAAKNAYVKGYKIAAKTGTSEKTEVALRDEEGNTVLRTGSCVAFGPSDDPQIAMIIICDEPSGESVFGSVTAAPYVASAMGDILRYMNVDPVYSEAELADMEVNVSSYTGLSVAEATAALNQKGLTYKIYGDGTTVTQQIPKSGSTVIQGSAVIVLYTGTEAPTESVTVPDLTGYSITGATDTLTRKGLNILLKGAVQSYTSTDSYAQAVSQSIPAGTRVTPGTVVTVEFRFTDAMDGG